MRIKMLLYKEGWELSQLDVSLFQHMTGISVEALQHSSSLKLDHLQDLPRGRPS